AAHHQGLCRDRDARAVRQWAEEAVHDRVSGLPAERPSPGPRAGRHRGAGAGAAERTVRAPGELRRARCRGDSRRQRGSDHELHRLPSRPAGPPGPVRSFHPAGAQARRTPRPAGSRCRRPRDERPGRAGPRRLQRGREAPVGQQPRAGPELHLGQTAGAIPGEDGFRARPRTAAPGRRPDQEHVDGVHQAGMSRRRLSPIVALPFVLHLAWPIAVSADPVIVNDITQLNPIAVARVVTPRTVDEVRELVRSHSGPISIGGGRFSMGGQIATEGSLFLDMRGMDRVVAFSPDERTITVEPGITWRKVQERIDPHGLSVKIMQSYANFTVGGSLSVNVHGRYVGQGPLIGSVRSIKVVLADGQVVEASPSQSPELFYGAIGGYGGLGIIVEATLELAEDVRIARETRKLKVEEYKDFFFAQVREAPKAVFHNGDIYPPAYDTVVAITWSATDRPVTVADRLMPVR